MLATCPHWRTSVVASSKGRGKADGLDGHVGALAAGETVDHLERVLAAIVDRQVGSELLGRVEAAVG